MMPQSPTPALVKGSRFQVQISDLAEDNKFFARHDGLAVFVTGACVIGDEVEVEIFKLKKNYVETLLVKVLTPSPFRTASVCDHFGTCGGCKWQHFDYTQQLIFKRKQVADALAHLGGFQNPPVAETIAADPIYHYRNKLEFSFGDRRFLSTGEMNLNASELPKPIDFALGFHTPNRYDKVIDIDQCHIGTEEMNLVLLAVKKFSLQKNLSAYSTKTHTGFLRNLVLRQSICTSGLMVNLVTSAFDEALMQDFLNVIQSAIGDKLETFVNNISEKQNSSAFGDYEKVIFGSGKIIERLGDFKFEISANSFFQTNSVQAEALYRETLRQARLSPSDLVYDLYCGTGSISIFISKACKKVLGIELIESSIENANANAKLNGVTNATFKRLDLKDFGKIEAACLAFGKPDVIITDPPRAGMHNDAIDTMLKFEPKRIVYVSCNAASLARDGKRICGSGVYRLVEVTPVDMFPHTYHIESVATFEK
jgi:23S rRNA (uracil1939-C5)-methyltransferase